jgi:hypothetical protein
MGVVYDPRELKTGRSVAVKRLLSAGGPRRERFLHASLSRKLELTRDAARAYRGLELFERALEELERALQHLRGDRREEVSAELDALRGR